ncbi:hypothetical protein HK102_007759 [Quaeritorhiza haematococci]|nr:hypothetical protein HK102_007759 [Quaeritorhiza haematococci]
MTDTDKTDKATPTLTPTPASDDDDEEDPYVVRLKQSGCYDQHITLQDCYWDKKDWRQCQSEIRAFRECFFKKHPDQENLLTYNTVTGRGTGNATAANKGSK